jgi:CheY-like chemotaxis protein
MGGPILIIEDDKDLRELMREWLETIFQGCSVIAAARQNGALSKAQGQVPGVILVDVDTAAGRDIDVIQQLKDAVPEATIIALTMDDHEALREDVTAAGALACVRKSDISDKLLPLLTDLLEPDLGPTAREKPRRTVLCIEDELEMIRLIELTLQRGPFQVIGAVSGQQGLDIARRVRPDVVLLDLMMPDMDGWEVAQRLREDETLRNVPIIAVSVVQPTNYPGRELPVDDYVMKPFRADDLLRRVSDMVRVVA